MLKLVAWSLGTAQAGGTLMADTPGIADDDGTPNAVFAYRWLADDAAIGGATASTYTLTSGEQGKTVKVTVTFTDDAGNEESLTSDSTAAVTQLLTATIHDAPDSHDGQRSFTFELRFSEEFGLSYKTLRDHAFTVTGGEVVKARRLNPPSSMGWEITVEPDGNAEVTVSLPATTDCASEGAICAEDGRVLSSAAASGVSLSVGEGQNHPSQSGLGRRHHIPAHGPGIPLPCGGHGLAQPVSGVLAPVQHS